MKIEKELEYIIWIKTIEEFEELRKTLKWYNRSATGTDNLNSFTDKYEFAVSVRNGEVRGFNSLTHYKNERCYKDNIFITMEDFREFKVAPVGIVRELINKPKTATEIVLKARNEDFIRLIKDMDNYEGYEFIVDISDIDNRFNLGKFECKVIRHI